MKNASRDINVVALGDFHCGHFAGLTPPDWRLDRVRDGTSRYKKIAEFQRQGWDWYAAKAKELGPVDLLLVNADLIDGAGDKSGGTEQLTTDRRQQVKMAIECVKVWNAKRLIFTYGTGYHTGNAEDWEDQIADHFGAKIGSHEWVTVNGVTFDLKHHIGSSSVPHGRGTAVAKDALWGALWAMEGEQPHSDIFIRSHVHYHSYTGGIRRNRPWLAMTLPALQLAGTKYGARRCSGTVDFGLVNFTVSNKGLWTWQPHFARLESQKVQSWQPFA